MQNSFLSKIFLILLLVIIYLNFCYLTPGQNWGGDFAQYILQAKSIVDGTQAEFLELSRFMFQNSLSPVWPVVYPWGVPLLLSPIYAIFGLNIFMFKMLNVLCFALFLITLWIGLKNKHPDHWRLLLVLLFGFNPVFLRFSNHIIADIPFLFISTLSVILIGKIVIEKRKIFSIFADHLVLGSVIAATMTIRGNGILILATLALTHAIVLFSETRKSFNLVSILKKFKSEIVPYLTVFILLVIWNFFFQGGNRAYEAFALQFTPANLYHYLILPSEFFIDLKWFHWIYFATLPLMIFGMVKRFKSDYHVIIYICLTICLLLCWPSVFSFRFLFPIFPFYFSFVMTAVQKNNLPRGKSLIIFIKLAVIGFIMVSFLIVDGEEIINNLSLNQRIVSGPFEKSAQDMFRAVKEETSKNSVIIFCKPRVMNLMTNRKALLIDKISELDRGDFLCIIRNNLYQIPEDEIQSLIKQQRLSLVYGSRNFQLYKINK